LKELNVELLEFAQRSLNWLASYPGEGANAVLEQGRKAIERAKEQKP
jgi:hypothetical protein